ATRSSTAASIPTSLARISSATECCCSSWAVSPKRHRTPSPSAISRCSPNGCCGAASWGSATLRRGTGDWTAGRRTAGRSRAGRRLGAGCVAAAGPGRGRAVVPSRPARGAPGPQSRSTPAPLQQLDALERPHEFLGALARWARRPAEWAHVPPAARGGPLVLEQAPVPVEVAPPAMAPPGGVDTIALPLLPDPKLARATSTPEWLRQQGMRVLWAPLF